MTPHPSKLGPFARLGLVAGAVLAIGMTAGSGSAWAACDADVPCVESTSEVTMIGEPEFPVGAPAEPAPADGAGDVESVDNGLGRSQDSPAPATPIGSVAASSIARASAASSIPAELPTTGPGMWILESVIAAGLVGTGLAGRRLAVRRPVA